MKENNKALIVIDVQNDFCPGGALAVNEGDKIVPVINRVMEKFDCIIATQDWHPGNHVSFASNHKGKKQGEVIDLEGIAQMLWPNHCVQGTRGAAFHKNLKTEKFCLILRKGRNPEIDSYSAFLENDKKTGTGLHGYLKALNIQDAYVCGLATDYCVYFTAKDSVKYGFKTHVIINACRGIDIPEGNIENVVRDMKNSGISIIDSGQI